MIGKKGTAAVEFAMVLPIILMCLAILTDFGLASRAKGTLATAIATGAQYAAASGPDVTPAAITSIIRDQLSPATITIDGPACGCASATAITPNSCNALCPDGTHPGTYVAITASRHYTPMLPLYSQFGPTDLTDTAQVRLK